MDGAVNAVEPRPKRPLGTGMVGQCVNGRWRYRLPGGRIERGGFESRAEAETALTDALAGRDWKLVELRRAVKRTVQLAQELQTDLGALTRRARMELMLDGARERRAAERAARAAEEEKEAR